MPCMSYESDWARDSGYNEVKRIKKEADKLARIACKALTELESQGRADFLLLKDEEVRSWWEKHQEDDQRAREKAEARARREQLKQGALAKLSDEERKVLGIKL
jgi:hypothetical protein